MSKLIEEHQTRALLIKIGWILIAGLPLLVISTLWTDDSRTTAYLLAKIGTNVWLISAFGLILAANKWLRDKEGLALTSLKVIRINLVLVLLWLLLSLASLALASPSNRQIALVDLIGAFVGLVIVLIARLDFKRHRYYGETARIARVVLIARLDCVAWLIASALLLGAGIIWFLAQEQFARMSAVAVLFPVIIALVITFLCLRILSINSESRRPREQMATATAAENSTSSEEKPSLVAPGKNAPLGLGYVARMCDWAAGAVLFCSIMALLGTAVLKVKMPSISVSTTVVAAFIGCAASIMALFVKIVPKFDSDQLSVFASAMGTQYIYTIELLSTGRTAEEIKEIPRAIKE